MLVYDELILREPGLYVPGRKPVGPVRADPRVYIFAWPERNVQLGYSGGVTLGPLTFVQPHPDARHGKAWWTGTSASEGDWVEFTGSARGTLNAFTILWHGTINDLDNQSGLFGNFDRGPSQILFRIESGEVQLYIRDGNDNTLGPATHNNVPMGVPATFVARYDGTSMQVFVDGIPGDPSIIGFKALTPTVDFRIGYIKGPDQNTSSQKGIAAYVPMLLMLDAALPDSEIKDVSDSRDWFRFLTPT